MSDALERVHAAFVLRLLIERGAPLGSAEHVDWSTLLSVATENNVLLRVAERLNELRVEPPEAFASAVTKQAERSRAMFAVIRRVTQICSAHGIAFVFPKALEHVPDFGRDIDLLLLSRLDSTDMLITEPLGATRVGATLESKLAGATAYRVPGCPALLDIHHGRLGNLGEETGFPSILIGRRRLLSVGGAVFHTATREDQLVLQGMRRLYGRPLLRLSDVVYTCLAVRTNDIDWDDVLVTAKAVGAFHGLSCHLSYVDQIYSATFGVPLLPSRVRGLLRLGGWGRVEFRAGAFRYPALRVGGSLYARKLVSELLAGDWDAAGRVGLVPFLAAAAAIRRASRPWARPRRDPPAPELAPYVAS